MLGQQYTEDEHNVTLTVPLFELSRLTTLSYRWPHAEPLPLSALHNQGSETIYASTMQTFNKMQTQVFEALCTLQMRLFSLLPGSGKAIYAEFVLVRLWSTREQPRAVCIEPYREMVD